MLQFILTFILIMCVIFIIDLLIEIRRADAYHEACMKALDNVYCVLEKHSNTIDAELASEIIDSTPSVKDMSPGFAFAILSMIEQKIKGGKNA